MPVVFWLLLDDEKNGLLFTAVFSLTQPFLLAANHALNSHPMIYLYPLILLLISLFFLKSRPAHLWTAFFLISTGFHFNVVVASLVLLAILITLLIFMKKRAVKPVLKACPGFLIPFLPQILFEFRHGFLQTKTLLKLLRGNSGSISLTRGSFSTQLGRRLLNLAEIFKINQGFEAAFWSLAFLLLVFFTIVKIKKKKRLRKKPDYLFLVSFRVNLIVLTGVFLSPLAIWPWYISSIRAGLFFLFTTAVYWQVKNNLFLTRISLILFTGWLVWGLVKLDLYPFRPNRLNDPSNLRLRLRVINQIYHDNQGQGMKIFTFAPNVYDYPYQYLIWYQARQRYGYLPEEYAYLPGQPEYVPAKKAADSLLKAPLSTQTYLIIEPPESQGKWFHQWRSNFGETTTVWQIGKTGIEKQLPVSP